MHVFQISNTIILFILFVCCFRAAQSSSDILEMFIISGLHPRGNRPEDSRQWPHRTAVVCLIDYSDHPSDIVIKHNTQNKHAEELLIEYINSTLDITTIECIKIYSNYSSCTLCSDELISLNDRVPDLQIKFSSLYKIRRPSCYYDGCSTKDPGAFGKLRELNARPFQNGDWGALIILLRRYDELNGNPIADLDGLRNGDEYRVWRNGEDERLMADYEEMSQ